MPSPKAEHLVVDTSAFIKNENLRDIASNVYTVQGVVDEITHKRQLRKLVVLPYDLIIKDVFPENIKFVTEFSKKTGDYNSLTAVDIQVMALTYQLEKEHVGTAHIHTQPNVQKVTKLSEEMPTSQLAVTGFYMPPTKFNQQLKLEEAVVADKPVPTTDIDTEKAPEKAEEDIEEEEEHVEAASQNPWQWKQVPIKQNHTLVMNSLKEALLATELPERAAEGDAARIREEEMDSEEDDEIWDENAWITPDNLEEAKKEIKAAVEEDDPVAVACITGDFAMQNVIKQMGMKVMAPDGRIIKQLRTYILRCYACFKTTSKTGLLFCPHCGNRTLRRAAVLLKPDGTEEVLISTRRPITSRGKKFSLPRPKGGHHAVNPILCADQKLPQQQISKLARAKNNPLEPDYIAGFSPFLMRDVTSRSAVLGIRSSHSQIKNWMRHNPNEVVKKGKKKK